MSEHTPGPWEVTDSRHVSTGKTLYLFENKSAKAGELRANARLIAAAPETKRQRDELLEALEFVRSELSSECGDRGEEHGLRSALMGIIRAIDEAIANATKEEA